ncbi:hypothetical protein E4U45_003708 [Claviceps purpurea]|nr:hypothetical protein E4U45_003708 [Claviceps purpurea]
MKDVPADGSPSKRTGESFTCLIWVKDVLVALYDCGEIVLPATIDVLEGMDMEKGLKYAKIADGGGGATVTDKGS